MSAKLIVPFDNNPASTSIKTTSYTIPAGKYARVRDQYGDLSLNSTPVYTLLQEVNYLTTVGTTFINTNTGFDIAKITTTSTVSNGLNGTFFGLAKAWYEGGTTLTYDDNGGMGLVTHTSFTGTRTSYYVSDKNTNQRIVSANTAGASSTAFTFRGYFFTTSEASGVVTGNLKLIKSNNNEFWVPTGTILEGLGYMVTEYNVIS